MDQPEPAPGGGPESSDTLLTVAAYTALGLLGALLGLIGAFAQGWMIGSVPAGAITLIVVNFAAPRLAGWAMGSRMAAGLLVFLWADAVFLLSVRRGEGDLVVPGTLTGYLFIIGGLVAGVIAVARVPSAREPGGWLTRGVSAPRR